ncbi:Autophagy-related protein 8 [Balamuthia mandrillaris]
MEAPPPPPPAARGGGGGGAPAEQGLINVEPELANAAVEDDHVAPRTIVEGVEASNSLDWNAVKVLRVQVYNPAVKAAQSRVVSKKRFCELIRFKHAWKTFCLPVNRKRKREALRQELLPAPASSVNDAAAASSSSSEAPLDLKNVPRRLRRAERILAQRTGRILLVLERCHDVHNQMAVLRTAECLGLQYVWMVLPVSTKKKKFLNKQITRGSEEWLSIRTFESTEECIAALRQDRREIWVTDLSLDALSLDDDIAPSSSPSTTSSHQGNRNERGQKADHGEEEQKQRVEVPARVAVVIGREGDGASAEMLEAADRRVYMPMHGFSDSFNLSVATALVLQRLLSLCGPSARGDLPEEEKQRLRRHWYTLLAATEEKREVYARYLAHPPPPLNDVRSLDKDRVPRVKGRVLKKVRQLEACQNQAWLSSHQQKKPEEEGEEEEKYVEEEQQQQSS